MFQKYSFGLSAQHHKLAADMKLYPLAYIISVIISWSNMSQINPVFMIFRALDRLTLNIFRISRHKHKHYTAHYPS